MKKQIITLVVLILTAPAALQAREFLNTVVHLNFGGMYTFTTAGNIIESEKSVVDSEFTGDPKVSHYETAYCATLDIVPFNPILLGMEEHAIKIGIRGSYRFHFLQQRVADTVEVGDKVMDYRSWMVGPVIHYAPFIEPSDLSEDYTASGGFTFYALAGKINGDLTAFPAAREKSGYTGPYGEYSTGISGYKFDIGVGAEIALCSLNFGVNLYYSYVTFDMDKKIYSDSGRSGYLKEGCLELYVGIPIESFIEPLIPRF
jgi:hypothetical protein